MVCPLIQEFFILFDHAFFFIMHLPYSRFILTYQVQPIIEEVEFDEQVVVDPEALAVQGYDPPPSREYARYLDTNTKMGWITLKNSDLEIGLAFF